MKTNQNILLEIERMREIMGMREFTMNHKHRINETFKQSGLKLILEAGGSDLPEQAAKRVLKALGFDPNLAEQMGKQAAEQFDTTAKNFFKVLEKEGLDDIGKIQKALTNVGTDASKLTDDVIDNALKLYFKNNPEIAKDILKNSTDFTRGIVNKLPLDDLIPAGMRADFDTIINANSGDLTSPAIQQRLNKVIGSLENDPTIQGKIMSDDPDTIQLLQGLRRTKDAAEKINNPVDTNVPTDTPVITKDNLTTNKKDVDLDAEIERRNKQKEEIKAQKEFERVKKQKIKNVKESFLNLYKEQLEDMYSSFKRFLAYFGIGNYDSFIKQIEKEIGDSTIEELESGVAFKKAQIYLGEKIKALPVKTQKEVGEVNNRIDQFIESIPFGIGKTYKRASKFVVYILGGFLGLVVVNFATSYFTESGKGVPSEIWAEIKELTTRARNEFVPYKYPDCLSVIEGYYYLTDEQQRMVPGTKLTCDNVDPEKPQLYATYIRFKKGSSAYDPTQNKNITKPDMFIVTIGGKDVGFTVGEAPENPDNSKPETDNQKTYTNDPAGFKKWVEDNGKTYGIEGGNVWEDGKPFTKDANGNWQKIKHDGATFNN
jgi:hypothetical protein